MGILFLTNLGTFPISFYLVVTFQGYFSKFNFTYVQFPKRQLPKFVLYPSVQPPNLLYYQRLALIAARGRPIHNLKYAFGTFGKLHIWEISIRKIITWEVALG